MGLNIKDLMGGGISKVLDSAKGVIGQFIADPAEKAAALQALENEGNRHQETLITQANDIEKAYLADTQDAREANARIQESDKASWLSKNVGYIIDLFLTTLFGTVTIILFLKIFKVAGADVDMVSLMALHGTVTAVFMTVVNFHRGTSIGSKENGARIDKMIKKM